MKKVLILLTVASFSIPNLQAQTGSIEAPAKVQLGVKAGLNLNRLRGVGLTDATRAGFHIGGFARFNLTRYVGLQPEVLINRVSSQTTEAFRRIYPTTNTANQTFGLTSLSIPVLVNIGNSQFCLQVGPQYSRLLGGNRSLGAGQGNAFKRGEFSAVVGVWLQFGRLSVSGRYIHGLTNIANLPEIDPWRNRNYQFGVGVTL